MCGLAEELWWTVRAVYKLWPALLTPMPLWLSLGSHHQMSYVNTETPVETGEVALVWGGVSWCPGPEPLRGASEVHRLHGLTGAHTTRTRWGCLHPGLVSARSWVRVLQASSSPCGRGYRGAHACAVSQRGGGNYSNPAFLIAELAASVCMCTCWNNFFFKIYLPFIYLFI